MRKKTNKQTPSHDGIEPPQVQLQRLSEVTGAIALVDHAAYQLVQLNSVQAIGQTADDLLFDHFSCKNTHFTDSTFTIMQIMDGIFAICDLSNVTLEKPSIRRIEFHGCRMLGIALIKADIQDLAFHKCNAALSRFWDCTIKSAIFDQCSLSQASFANSDLSGVIFRDCDLSNTDFQGAKLKGTDFRGSNLTDIQLHPKDIQGAIIDPTQATQLAKLFGVIVRDKADSAL